MCLLLPRLIDVNRLKEVLGKLVYGRLEKRRQAEEILAAGIEGIYLISKKKTEERNTKPSFDTLF